VAKEDKNKKYESYSAKDISVLEGLEPVRKRPGMYIGSTGLDGLHHLIWEVVDNSLDEAMGGYCKNIDVLLLPGNRVQVKDDGRGIPVDIHPQKKISALQIVLTTLHAGGKFDNKAYQVCGRFARAWACRWCARCPLGPRPRCAATGGFTCRNTTAANRAPRLKNREMRWARNNDNI